MAPKRKASEKSSSSRSDKGKDPMIGSDERMLDVNQRNRYLFKDKKAYERFENEFGSDRPISECCHFSLQSMNTMSHWERDFLQERIDYWGWRDLIEMEGVGYDIVTRLFYANMDDISNEETIAFKTKMFGQHITINPTILASALNIKQEGEQTYSFPDFPELANESEYRSWFADNSDSGKGEPMSASHLPGVHLLLFFFINNILFCESTIKYNLEKGVMYLLKHLLCMDRKFDICYIVVKHMLQVRNTMNSSLPYSHLIAQLIAMFCGKCFPLGNRVISVNLAGKMTKYGWDKTVSEDGIVIWTPKNNKPVNTWIRMPGAVINQYYDPINTDNSTQEPKTNPAETSSQPPSETPWV